MNYANWIDIELSNKDHIEVDTSNFFEGTTIWALDVRLRLNSKLF